MPADVPPSVHVIDYAYETNGVFYHGTISNLDDKPKSTWTISVSDKKTQLDQPIDEATFSFLWNGLGQFAVFKKSVITDPNTKMDFYHFQVIGAIDGKQGIRSYLVAPSQSDSQYEAWIEKLHVPFEKSGQ